MADRRRLVYAIKFVVITWIAIVGLAGIVIGIYYVFRKNITVTIIASQLLIYSGAFAFMGWQQYKWRGRKNRLQSGQGWERFKRKLSDESDESDERENGWK